MKSISKSSPSNLQPVSILVNGVYYSGASAFVDFCCGIENTIKYPGEFSDFRSAGLIGDLASWGLGSRRQALLRSYMECNRAKTYLYPRSHFSRLSRRLLFGLVFRSKFLIYAIARFLPWGLLPERFLMYASMLCLYHFSKSLRHCAEPRHVLERAIDWKSCLMKRLGSRYDYVIFDQPIYLTQHLKAWRAVFDPLRLIVIIRDPRDQIADIISNGKLFNDFYRCGTNGIADIYGNDSEGAIKYHLDRLKKQYERIFYLKQVVPADRILVVSFEWFTLSFCEAKPVILSFLGMDNEPAKWSSAKSRFCPSRSKNNIGIYRQYPEIMNLIHVSDGVMRDYRKLSAREL